MSNLKGIFKDEIINFIEYKRTNGFYNNNSVYHKLAFFDKYTVSNSINKKELTKELVTSFIDSLDNKTSSKNGYASTFRQFAIYLEISGIKAYHLPIGYYPRKYNFIPHIYTSDEVKHIFEAIDNCYLIHNKKKQEQIRLIFELLFGTGMRISEVLNIKRSNINYDKGSILIEETKNGCDRLILVGNTLINKMKEFELKYNKDYLYYFENEIEKKYNPSCIYSIFRKLLFIAKIMHDENGPRLHDIRHTFAVNSFKHAIKENRDLNNFLPLLSTYMGHKDLSSTYKYLRLTAEVFPSIKNKIEKYIVVNKVINYDEF